MDAVSTSRVKNVREGAPAHVASLDSDRSAESTDNLVEGTQRVDNGGPNARPERVSRENLVPYYAGKCK